MNLTPKYLDIDKDREHILFYMLIIVIIHGKRGAHKRCIQTGANIKKDQSDTFNIDPESPYESYI